MIFCTSKWYLSIVYLLVLGTYAKRYVFGVSVNGIWYCLLCVLDWAHNMVILCFIEESLNLEDLIILKIMGIEVIFLTACVCIWMNDICSMYCIKNFNIIHKKKSL